MQQINVTFDGFWSGFNCSNNFITRLLRKYYYVNVFEAGEKVDQTDVIFCSVYYKQVFKYDCIRVFYTGENFFPDFNIFDYAIGFESLNLGDRYFRYTVTEADFCEDIQKLGRRQEMWGNEPFSRKFCATVVSNGLYADPFRDEFFEKLCDYKMVDSGGSHMNNIGNVKVPEKIPFLSNYKFSLAFENSSTSGYCTEKLIQSFAAGTIPIYWGDYSLIDGYNIESFIFIESKTDVDLAINKIIEIDNNENEYMKMLRAPIFMDPNIYEKRKEELTKWLIDIIENSFMGQYRRNKYGYIQVYSQNYERSLEFLKRQECKKNVYDRIRHFL